MIRSRTLVARFVFAVVLVGLQQLATGPAEAVKRRAFVTSEVGSGNLHSWLESGDLFGLAAAVAPGREGPLRERPHGLEEVGLLFVLPAFV